MPYISKAKWLHRAHFDLTTQLPGEQAARDALGLPDRTILQACFLYPGVSGFDDFDSITDSSGLNHPALAKTSACPSFVSATPSYVAFATGAPFSGEDAFTVSCWIYITTNAAYQEIITTNNTSIEWRIDTSRRLEVVIGGTSVLLTSVEAISLSTWTHIALVFDQPGNSVKQYINGVLCTEVGGSDSTPTAVFPTITSWRIGARGDGTLPLNAASMSRLEFSTAVLTAGNLLSAVAGAPVTTGLTNLWPMEERGGTLLYDVVGGNHGTSSGLAWATRTQEKSHWNARYGATVYLDGSTTNTYGNVPHNSSGTAITHSANKPFGGTNSNLVGDFGGGQMFEGTPDTVDWSNAGAGWSSGLGLETSYAFSTTRTTPRYSLNTESTLVKFCRAGTAKIVSYFGTSLTSGTGGDWATNTTAWLNDRNNTITAFNDASSGKQSTWGLANISTVTGRSPKFCFLETFSMNDSDTGSATVTIAQHRSNVIGMIDAILAAEPTCVIYLMIMNPTTTATANGTARRPDLASYYEEDRDIAAGYSSASVKVIDFHLNVWTPLSEADLLIAIDDGVHPNQTASDQYIVPYLRSQLVGVTKNCYLFAAS